ncbi:MAG: DegV family protein [Clostridia bacterium]|nr:DegV family protein [Clostridia bacterium]
MKKYVIVTDSCSDLHKGLREKYDIDYIPMHLIIDGERDIYADLDFNEISYEDYFNMLREGTRIKTAQVNAQEYKQAFTKYLEAGFDILSISCSSALSASIKASQVARDELLEAYPDAKIYCIDSLNSCFGLGIICMTASELRAEGKTIEEVAAWIEENKLKVHQECTVEKLTYLKNAGRVSAAKAFFGGLLNKKPIIISDAVGQNHAIETVKGRRASMERLAERMFDEYEDHPYQKVVVCHADDIEAAEEFKAVIEAKFAGKELNIHMDRIGPIIGTSAGPGTIAVYFIGTEVTENKA